MKQRISLGCFPQKKETGYLLNFIEDFNSISQNVEVIPQFLNEQDIAYFASENFIKPDIITIYSGEIVNLANSNLIVPLSNFFSDEEIKDIYPEVLKSARWKNEIWMIPLLEGNPNFLLYNKNLFASSGIKNYPHTWDDVINSANILTKDNDRDGLLDQWGLWLDFNLIYLFIWQNLGDILDEQGAIIFNDKRVVDTLIFLIKLKKYLSPHSEFERGNIGMTFTNKIDIQKYQTFNFGISPLPLFEKRINSFGREKGIFGFSVVNNNKGINECIEFLRWWNTKDVYLKWCLLTDLIPLKNSIVESEEYQEYLNENSFLKILLDEIEISRVVPNLPIFNTIQDILINIVEEIESLDETSEEKIKEKLKNAENYIKETFPNYER